MPVSALNTQNMWSRVQDTLFTHLPWTKKANISGYGFFLICKFELKYFEAAFEFYFTQAVVIDDLKCFLSGRMTFYIYISAELTCWILPLNPEKRSFF